MITAQSTKSASDAKGSQNARSPVQPSEKPANSAILPVPTRGKGNIPRAPKAGERRLQSCVRRFSRPAMGTIRTALITARIRDISNGGVRIGAYRLAQITPQSLLPYREELLKSVTPTTCQRYFASLSGAFTWAMKDERQWVAANPVRLVTKPRDQRPQEERERVRFLSAEERTRLFAACAQSRSPWLYQSVLMALVTGARKSEILTLRWRDVDVQAGTVCFRNTKNGSDRTITLVDPVLTLLRERHSGQVIPHPESYVFPAPCGTKPVDMRTAWATAVRNAALE